MLNAPNPDGHGYTVFGKVVSGTEVVDKIRAVRTGMKSRMRDVPVEPVTIRVRHASSSSQRPLNKGASHEQSPSRTHIKNHGVDHARTRPGQGARSRSRTSSPTSTRATTTTPCSTA